MATHGGAPDGIDDLFTQHRELRALLTRIDETLRLPTSSVEEISQLLAQLGDRLVYHFTSEEEGGYFAEALLHAPQLVAKANALLDQHPEMCHRAKSLGAELDRTKLSSENWRARTAELFKAFCAELMRHEEQENLLLQEAYQRDIGLND